MKARWRKSTVYAVLAAGVVLFALPADALPAFGRKYQTSCVTCHESFPRLNGIGEAFRLNGYKFQDDELYVKEEPLELGDEAYKRVWPNAIWPGNISEMPPISFVLKNRFVADIGGTKDARTEFIFPREAEIMGSGTLGDNISYFVELEFEQEAEDRGGSELETALDGWVMFEDLIGPENAVNLRVGAIGTHEIGLYTARDANRLTIEHYLYARWRQPVPDDVSVESANAFRLTSQSGVEINGFGKRWRYATGVVNGNGSINDDNSEKDLYLQLAYKFGGRALDGSALEGNSALSQPEPWRDDSFTVALLAYYGTATIVVSGVDDQDRFWRVGPGVRWKHRDLAINAGYIAGRNDDPYGPFDTVSVDSDTWFVEGEYFVFPWLTTVARYEALSLDLATTGPGAAFINPEQDQQRIILSAKALIRANLSVTLEGRFYIEDETNESSTVFGDDGDANQIAVGVTIVF